MKAGCCSRSKKRSDHIHFNTDAQTQARKMQKKRAKQAKQTEGKNFKIVEIGSITFSHRLHGRL